MLPCVAVCCSAEKLGDVTGAEECVELRVAACCSVLQCVAVCCRVLQCFAVCCSVLQCVVVCCIVEMIR